MYDNRLTRLRVMLALVLAFGCSVASLSGTLAAVSAGIATAAAPRQL